MKKIIQLFSISVLLAGCAITSPELMELPTTPLITDIVETKTPAFTIQPVSDIKHTITPYPENSTTPTNRVTSDLKLVVTDTPAQREACPPQNPNLLPDIESMLAPGNTLVGDEPVLEYLNSGGTKQVLISSLEQGPLNDIDVVEENYDYTGDSIPELIITSDGNYRLYVFGCEDGFYRTLYASPNEMPMLLGWVRPSYLADINSNGMPELFLVDTVDNAPTAELKILEWDGNQFISLIEHEGDFGQEDFALMISPTEIKFDDLDSDGIQEMIIVGGIPTQMAAYTNGLPFRQETVIFKWNGVNYIQISHEFSPPQYHYQAAQDGDRAFLEGSYEEAFSLYEQAIYSEELAGWSYEHWKNLFEIESSHWGSDATPTIIATNNGDYDYIAAYAHYRLMLLYVIQENFAEAEKEFNKLQSDYPLEQPGNIYANIASLFWTEYQSSNSVTQACEKVVQFAFANQDEVLSHLGGRYHGWQSIFYEPEDICPMK